MSNRKVAEKVTLDLAEKTLTVDGSEFPWELSREPIVMEVDTDICISTVTVTFFAEATEVLPAKDGPRE